MIHSTLFAKMQPTIAVIIAHLKHGFDITATWVTNLSWKKFILFAIVMMIIGGIIQDRLFAPNQHPVMIKKKSKHHKGPTSVDIGDDTNVRIDESGIHILKKGSSAGDGDVSTDNPTTTSGLPAASAEPGAPTAPTAPTAPE